MTYHYDAEVIRWIDGDTVELDVDLGFRLRYRDHFRLDGIDTPERGKPLAAEAKARAMSLTPAGSTVHIGTTKGDKYGRWLAVIWPSAGMPVNTTLVAEGLAKPYYGGKKE
jgi:micrococcal nuclease